LLGWAERQPSSRNSGFGHLPPIYKPAAKPLILLTAFEGRLAGASDQRKHRT
jgi:hypothetical protein